MANEFRLITVRIKNCKLTKELITETCLNYFMKKAKEIVKFNVSQIFQIKMIIRHFNENIVIQYD